MSGEELFPQTDLSELSEQLQDGIETCRSVIANYRLLPAEEPVAAKASRKDSVEDDLPPPK
jgi:hypothetical protein